MNKFIGKLWLGALAGVLLLSGCVVQPQKDLSAFQAAQIKSILVVPAINRSLDVDAANYFLSTISVPLANRGYYVFPVNTVKRMLDEDGLADSDLVHKADTARLAALFGADAVLYVSINRWDAQYALITTTVTVDFTYTIKDGRSGESLWTDQRVMQYQPDQGRSTGNPLADLIGAAVSAAITKAAPNYLPLTRTANFHTVSTLPLGPFMDIQGQPTRPVAGAVPAATSAPAATTVAPALTPVALASAPATPPAADAFASFRPSMQACRQLLLEKGLQSDCDLNGGGQRPVTLVVGLMSMEDVRSFGQEVVARIANPYCETARKSGGAANLKVVLAKDRQHSLLECSTGAWGPWQAG